MSEESSSREEMAKGLIKALSELIIEKDKEIDRLQSEVKKLAKEIADFPQVVVFPSVQQYPIMCNHIYPFPWHGTTPPSCVKCGFTPQNNLIVTCSTSSSPEEQQATTTQGIINVGK